MNPSLLFVSALQNAVSTALPRWSDQKIDMRNFISVANKRLANHNLY